VIIFTAMENNKAASERPASNPSERSEAGGLEPGKANADSLKRPMPTGRYDIAFLQSLSDTDLNRFYDSVWPRTA
jgi:hypothetical protein